MAKSRAKVDFLVVTALPEEAEAVCSFLRKKKNKSHFVLGEIMGPKGKKPQIVAVAAIGDMGTDKAQTVTGKLIDDWICPTNIIMCGIAAGFPESGVHYGDILVPSHIVPYELAKIKEQRKSGRKEMAVEHREYPCPVDQDLSHVVKTLAIRSNSFLLKKIKKSRPDDQDKAPRVYCKSGNIVGSGNELSASKRAEHRRWLLKTYRKNALGLEMESYGVLLASQARRIPFLMVKAVQDYGTGSKSDTWREYAFYASAAFVTELIRCFEINSPPLESSGMFSQYKKELGTTIREFAKTAEHPNFAYKIRMEDSYLALEQDSNNKARKNYRELIPGVRHKVIILYGGGGAGKTRILRNLLQPAVEKGLLPIYIDLKAYSRARRNLRSWEDQSKIVRDIIEKGSIPKLSPSILRGFARKEKVAIFIDGLNEITRFARNALVDFLREVRRNYDCYVLIADRFGSPENIEAFSYALVENLDEATVEKMFDKIFGSGAFKQKNKLTRSILSIPFFLSLALKEKTGFKGKSIRSQIFEGFFVESVKITPGQLDRLALITLRALRTDSSFDPEKFRKLIGNTLIRKLIGSGVIEKNSGDFKHDLWREYLISRSLAKKQAVWTSSTFDIATRFASSLECLPLAIEQIASQKSIEEFLKSVYDWNYLAAADCVGAFCERTQNLPVSSQSIVRAVLSAVAEKQFDPIEHTRVRSRGVLRRYKTGILSTFASIATKPKLLEYVRGFSGTEKWFIEWKSLFTKIGRRKFTTEEINSIASEDPIIGWTAANLARRSILNVKDFKRLSKIYRDASHSLKNNSIRWRIIHVLGAHPSKANIEFLAEVLRNRDNTYLWVKYGAVRALMEIAAYSKGILRGYALRSIANFIGNYRPTIAGMRRNIILEIVEASFINNPKAGWKRSVKPILNLILKQEMMEAYYEVLQKRVADFIKFVI